jgi:hypothetical protein
MSARTSRLDTLLRVRRIEEETGRGHLAAVAHAERDARGLLEKASHEYAAATGAVATGAFATGAVGACAVASFATTNGAVTPAGVAPHGTDLVDAAPTALSDFLGTRRRHEALAGTVRVAGAGLTQAQSASDMARTAWSAAAMRLSALERLDERGREADRLARLATDQRTAEESASRRTARQGRAS